MELNISCTMGQNNICDAMLKIFFEKKNSTANASFETKKYWLLKVTIEKINCEEFLQYGNFDLWTVMKALN